ncbi:MAG TPA: gluconokinase [Caulobacteraceae bacterium]|nr:gluconokinase [Caulobacteraceae bacterium]
MADPVVLVTMCVSGAGKTTLGEMLAARLGWPFKEGDELHPPANVAKMKSGHPLNDADRAPWLAAVGEWIDGWVAAGESGVISCSALKRAYRDTIAAGRPAVRFVFIDLDEATIAARLQRREHAYWPPALLHSQFEALQVPTPDEPVIMVNGHASRDAQVDEVVAALGLVP